MNHPFDSIKPHLSTLKAQCQDILPEVDEPHEEAYLRSLIEVLEGFERSLDYHFHQNVGNIVSPKSLEPWD